MGTDNLGLESILSIYPNPATNQLYLKTNKKMNSIVIVGLTGQVIKPIPPTNNSIDISNISSGIYFLQLETDTEVINLLKRSH